MSRLTGDPIYDLLIVLVFVMAAVALVRSRTGRRRDRGGRGWNALRREREAELAARRGTAPPPFDPDEVEDSAPLVRLVRRRATIGAVLFVVMVGCLAALWLWRWTQG